MYGTVLVPTDGSDNARLATERGIDLAASYDATVHGLYVVEKTRDDPELKGHDEKLSEEVSRAKAVLDAFEAQASERGLPVETAREVAVPRTTIVEYTENHDVDLVVVGSTGASDVTDKLLGTVAKYVVNEAPADVLVVRPDETLL